MKRLACLAVVACLLGSALPGTGRAGFVSQSVDISYEYPTIGTVLEDDGTKTIAALGTQFDDSFGDVITVKDTSIDIANIGDNIAVAFNGFAISEVGPSPSKITGASLGTTTYTGFDTSRITFDSTHVFVNFEGLLNPGNVTVDVAFAPTAAPEPASLTLLGIGVASVAGYGWRRRKRTA